MVKEILQTQKSWVIANPVRVKFSIIIVLKNQYVLKNVYATWCAYKLRKLPIF